MRIDILCSSPDHPVTACLRRWIEERSTNHDIALLRNTQELRGGDVLFLVSCTEIVEKMVRNRYSNALVLHASDLPEGRGWSPHIWAVLEGAREIVVSLLNAEDRVDTGDIWGKRRFPVPPHALYDEINAALFATELELMDHAIDMIESGQAPTPQSAERSSTWPRRTPEDSEIDPVRPLSELFDAIRVADPHRYPAFFRLRGHIYTIQLKKVGEDGQDQN